LEDHLFGDWDTRLALTLLGQEDVAVPLHIELLDVILYLPLDLLQVLKLLFNSIFILLSSSGGCLRSYELSTTVASCGSSNYIF